MDCNWILVVYRPQDGRVVGLYPNGECRNGAIHIGDHMVAAGVSADLGIAYVPPQDVSRFYPDDSPEIQATYPNDFALFTPDQLCSLIDRQTEHGIGNAVHPVAPLGEQIGILRDQMVHILNALGIKPTPEFARLNKIAIAAIQEGQAQKEALNESDSA